MREYSRPSPIDRSNRARLARDRRQSQRIQIRDLAAEFAEAIRADDRDALDRAQAALHRLDDPRV